MLNLYLHSYILRFISLGTTTWEIVIYISSTEATHARDLHNIFLCRIYLIITYFCINILDLLK